MECLSTWESWLPVFGVCFSQRAKSLKKHQSSIWAVGKVRMWPELDWVSHWYGLQLGETDCWFTEAWHILNRKFVSLGQNSMVTTELRLNPAFCPCDPIESKPRTFPAGMRSRQRYLWWCWYTGFFIFWDLRLHLFLEPCQRKQHWKSHFHFKRRHLS